jgi:vitamin B12 transporter
MYSHFLKKLTLTLFFILFVTSSYQPAFGDSEADMQILLMFYDEKDLVVSPTRHPKPISQVAENITVITAKEIEEMNAHTVAEVLNRVPGVFVDFTQDFGAFSKITIQGSEDRQVLFLIDGIVPWNFLSEGSAETNSIPVGIIERIEIIKGPASSTWGSSLGGVVNILTKPTGDTEKPTGLVRASYGEKSTQDYRADVAGKIKSVGYYLYAGRQESDGLRDSRDFENNSFYSKFNIPVSKDVNLNLNAGYSEPDQNFGEFPSASISSRGEARTFFATASLDAVLAPKLTTKVSLYTYKSEFERTDNNLGLEPLFGPLAPEGELFSEDTFDEKTRGGTAKLVWSHEIHTAVFGIDANHGKLNETFNAGSLLQCFGYPAGIKTNPSIDKWAVYFNDTINAGRFSITPGIRFDDNDLTDSFTSPSLGVTYKLRKDSIIRASAARGFTIPPLSFLSGRESGNPSLDPEEVWSFQVGAESTAAKYIWIKATAFYHELDKAIVREETGVENKGKVKRSGFEIEAETLPLYNFSALAAISYVDIDPSNELGANNNYSYIIGLRYDDRRSFRAQLFGRYNYWDLPDFWEAKYDNFIWDLNLIKKITYIEKVSPEIFFTAHNLFGSSYYTNIESKNPERWVEAGVRVRF